VRLRGGPEASRQGQPLGWILVVSAILGGALFYAALSTAGEVSSIYLGDTDIDSTGELDTLLAGDRPLAVMFKTLTCPTCKKMEPYWDRLEASDSLPLGFYTITFTEDTAEAFYRYGVSEVPTFIVFVDGEPAAVYKGAFPGPNVTRSMLDWALEALESPRPGGGSRLEPGGGATGLPLSVSVTEGPVSVAIPLIAFTIGAAAAFSPCALPLVALYGPSMARAGGRRAVFWALPLSVLGVFAVGAAFLALGSLVYTVQGALLWVSAATIMMAGFLVIFNVGIGAPSLPVAGRRPHAFFLLYGVLATQCSFPLVVGAMLLIASSSTIGVGFTTLLAFSLGLSLPLWILLIAVGRYSRLASLLSSPRFRAASGGLMIASSALIILYSHGVVV
jgi:cytochrome c biogenesis protein CcdA